MLKTILYIIGLLLFQSCSIFIPFKNLPKPDGEFIIGTDIFILEDDTRDELFTSDPSDYRKIVVQVWYPSSEVSDSIYPYLDYPDLRVSYIAKQIGKPESMIKHIGDIKANAYYNTRPVKEELRRLLMQIHQFMFKIQ